MKKDYLLKDIILGLREEYLRNRKLLDELLACMNFKSKSSNYDFYQRLKIENSNYEIYLLVEHLKKRQIKIKNIFESLNFINPVLRITFLEIYNLKVVNDEINFIYNAEMSNTDIRTKGEELYIEDKYNFLNIYSKLIYSKLSGINKQDISEDNISVLSLESNSFSLNKYSEKIENWKRIFSYYPKGDGIYFRRTIEDKQLLNILNTKINSNNLSEEIITLLDSKIFKDVLLNNRKFDGFYGFEELSSNLILRKKRQK